MELSGGHSEGSERSPEHSEGSECPPRAFGGGHHPGIILGLRVGIQVSAFFFLKLVILVIILGQNGLNSIILASS